MCREITKEEIHELIDAFAKTAKLCKEAGVDGIEVHAVHEGYLMDQFTLPYTNHRKDEYGGSFENRYRFAAEVVQAIKKACGKDYPVSLRYSALSKTKGFGKGAVPGEDYVEVGRDQSENERAVRFLEAAGYDAKAVQKRVNERLQEMSKEYYTVRKGDTLEKIARRFATSVQRLAEMNHLPDPNYIVVGQRLRVR